MVEYQHLTEDELLRLAWERDQLTDDARLALDAELSQRRISSADIESHKVEAAAADEADRMQRATPQYLWRVGCGKKFLGKTNRRRDPSGRFEQYEATLWFVVLWFPVYPVATYTVRRDLERWLGMVLASDEAAIERHPRNREQILLTWVKASAFLLVLRLMYLFLVHHPEWLRRVLR